MIYYEYLHTFMSMQFQQTSEIVDAFNDSKMWIQTDILRHVTNIASIIFECFVEQNDCTTTERLDIQNRFDYCRFSRFSRTIQHVPVIRCANSICSENLMIITYNFPAGHFKFNPFSTILVRLKCRYRLCKRHTRIAVSWSSISGSKILSTSFSKSISSIFNQCRNYVNTSIFGYIKIKEPGHNVT